MELYTQLHLYHLCCTFVEWRHFCYNPIDNTSIIAYARVLRCTAYPITGAQAAQYALGPFEIIKNYLIRLECLVCTVYRVEDGLRNNNLSRYTVYTIPVQIGELILHTFSILYERTSSNPKFEQYWMHGL